MTRLIILPHRSSIPGAVIVTVTRTAAHDGAVIRLFSEKTLHSLCNFCQRRQNARHRQSCITSAAAELQTQLTPPPQRRMPRHS